MVKINSRRYIGCKTKLLDTIYKTVTDYGYDNSSTFADIFSGTGAVADYFARHGFSVLFNDNLFSNYVIYQAFYNPGKIDDKKMEKYISYFNNLSYSEISDNYFSQVYADKYFSLNDSRKIGFIRDYIEDNKECLNEHEYYYLIASLMYAIDKVANTVGHYESFLRKQPKDSNFKMDSLEIPNIQKPIEIYNEDANELASKIKYDIAYIDPPYNARQYVNFYHVLENLARWDKPKEFEGNSMKFKRDSLKSDYCRKKAPELFDSLIQSLDCSLIVVSYNNTYNAKSISSNNTISEDQIIESLSKRGAVTKKEIKYKAFNAGKTDLSNHKEYLFICEVK